GGSVFVDVHHGVFVLGAEVQVLRGQHSGGSRFEAHLVVHAYRGKRHTSAPAALIPHGEILITLKHRRAWQRVRYPFGWRYPRGWRLRRILERRAGGGFPARVALPRTIAHRMAVTGAERGSVSSPGPERATRPEARPTLE